MAAVKKVVLHMSPKAGIPRKHNKPTVIKINQISTTPVASQQFAKHTIVRNSPAYISVRCRATTLLHYSPTAKIKLEKLSPPYSPLSKHTHCRKRPRGYKFPGSNNSVPSPSVTKYRNPHSSLPAPIRCRSRSFRFSAPRIPHCNG